MANRDNKAPGALTVKILGIDGKEMGTFIAGAKQFSTGSVGFYGNGKMVNPDNPEAKYQVGLTFTLIGSK